MNNKEDLKGLGGWLILVGIGIIIAPFQFAYIYGPIFYSLFTDGTFELLTTPGTGVYHSLWASLLMGETLCISFLILASVYLIYLFFSKHYLFPKIYITVKIFYLLFIPLDAWVVSLILIGEPIFTSERTEQFFITLIGVVIWVSYMLVSKRVKATFVEHRPNT